MVGATVSRTTTVNRQVEVLPPGSMAVQSTLVTPGANREPLDGMQLTPVTPAQSSFAVTLNVTIAPLGPVHSTRKSDGQVMAGGVPSTIRTVASAVRLAVSIVSTATTPHDPRKGKSKLKRSFAA